MKLRILTPRPLNFIDSTHIQLRRRTLLYFAGYGYLGLSFHPRVRRAMSNAARSGPLQAGASRATTGRHLAYAQFEKRLARFFGVEAAVSVPSGYLAPITACQGLRERIDAVLLDDLAHACVADGAALTGHRVLRFAHGDRRDLASKLKTLPRGARPLIACDGTRGTIGGFTPVASYLEALPRRGFLLVDDAHGAGATGPGGRGLCALLNLQDSRVVQTVSLAKAFGVSGGAILGAADLIAAVRNQGAGWIGSTPLLLPAVAALGAALDLILSEPKRVKRLQANAQLLYDLLPRRPEIQADPRTPVVGVFPKSPGDSESIRRALLRAGIYPPLIRYLTGPVGGFYRFAVLADHTPAEVKRLAAALSECYGQISRSVFLRRRLRTRPKKSAGESREFSGHNPSVYGGRAEIPAVPGG